MDFDFTDDQESLRDAVRRWVDKAFPFDRRHGIAKAGGATRAVYAELAELGLAGLAIPEAHGGLGFGPVEAMVGGEPREDAVAHARRHPLEVAGDQHRPAAVGRLEGERLDPQVVVFSVGLALRAVARQPDRLGGGDHAPGHADAPGWLGSARCGGEEERSDGECDATPPDRSWSDRGSTRGQPQLGLCRGGRPSRLCPRIDPHEVATGRCEGDGGGATRAPWMAER